MSSRYRPFPCAIIALATLLALAASPARSGAATFAAPPPGRLPDPASQTEEAGDGLLVYEGEFQTPLLLEPPPPPPPCDACQERIVPPVPEDPEYNPDEVIPEDEETGEVEGEDAPGDFKVFRNNQAVSAGLPGGVTSTTQEPSLGTVCNVVFVSGNWYAAISRDAGITWRYVDPRAFPAPPAADAGGFCCDQVVYYDRTQDLMIWLLQYSKNAANTHNIQRIAVTRAIHRTPDDNAITWRLYRTAAEDFGLPNTGFWVDFPDLAAGSTFLYATTNIFTTPANNFAWSAIYRMRLADLNAGPPIAYSWYRTNVCGTLRMVQGSTNIMYFAGHRTNKRLRAFMWHDLTSDIYWGELSHPGFSSAAMVATGPDGRNFAQGSDTRILGAYVNNPGGVPFLGFMWNAAQQGSYPFPYTRIVGESTSRIVVGGNVNASLKRSVWNRNYAWLYPAVTPNERGDLGGTITVGGGTRHPRAVAWIADAGNFAALDNRMLAASTNGPPPPVPGGAQNRWGDYMTARRNWYSGQTWSIANFIQVGANSGQARAVVAWFGRERDTPPADVQAHDVMSPGGVFNPGGAIGVGARAINIGAQRSGAVRLDFRASLDTTIDATDFPLGTRDIGALEREQDVYTFHLGSLPANIPMGLYYVGVIVTAAGDGGCPENNLAFAPLQIRVDEPLPVENVVLAGAPAPEGGVRLTWSLPAGERAAFIAARVERGEAAEGPFAAQASLPIEAGGRMSSAMSFDDRALEPGQSAWYQIALVRRDRSELLAGPIRVEAAAGSSAPAFATALRVAGAPGGDGPIQILEQIGRPGTAVRLAIYNVEGRLVRSLDERVLDAGLHLVTWDRRSDAGARAPRGVYIVQLQAGGERLARKLVLGQ